MKERQRQWHYNQSKRSELNETNLTNLTNLSEARSLKKYIGNKTLRSASNKPQPNCNSARDNINQQYQTQRSNKQRLLHRPDIENSLSYRILNEILNSPEVNGSFESTQNMHYSSLDRRSQPQPFDCSEFKGAMVVVDEQDETFSRVVDDGVLMAREDYRSWLVERTYHIARLDEVEFSLEKIAESQDDYFNMWSTIHETNEHIHVVHESCEAINANIRRISHRVGSFKDQLYDSAKDFIGGGLPTLEVDNKTCAVNRVVEAHQSLSSRVGSRSFMDALTFSIKVLLPTHLSNPTLFVLYTKLLEAKLAKKLILLMKKEANGLNPRDIRTVQEFTKVLSEEEINYSRKDSTTMGNMDHGVNNHKSESFHLQVAQLVERVEHLKVQIRELQFERQKHLQVTDGMKRQIQLQRGLINGKIKQEAQQLATAYHQATSNMTDFLRLVTNRIQKQEDSCMLLLKERSKLQRQLKKAPESGTSQH